MYFHSATQSIYLVGKIDYDGQPILVVIDWKTNVKQQEKGIIIETKFFQPFGTSCSQIAINEHYIAIACCKNNKSIVQVYSRETLQFLVNLIERTTIGYSLYRLILYKHCLLYHESNMFHSELSFTFKENSR